MNRDAVIKKLIAGRKTISTMESCTSGLIASMITDTEGASAIFPGGYVTYLNETKVFIGVEEAVIRQYGVYSKECARAMAQTVKEKLRTDIAIGITGIFLFHMVENIGMTMGLLPITGVPLPFVSYGGSSLLTNLILVGLLLNISGRRKKTLFIE